MPTQKKSPKKNNFKALLLIFPFLISCTTPSTVKPSESAKPASSPTPTVSVTPSPSISPSATPISSATATPSPSISPSISPTGDTSDISDFATLNGKVYDEASNLLDDIKITVRSLQDSVPFSGETTTVGGTYVFRNVPVGVPVEITAYKNDKWTKRVQTFVLKSNLTGDSTSNVVDFGDQYFIGNSLKSNFYFLTDAPEVIKISPERGNILQHDDFKVTLTFSEPVKKSSIEDNLVIRYVRDDFPIDTILGDGDNNTTNTDGPPSVGGNRQVIIDKYTTGRNFAWDSIGADSYGKEVTFSLDSSTGVITSNKDRIRYGITLRGKAGTAKIEDVDGNIGLGAGEFFVDNRRSKNVIFYADTDKIQPYLQSVKLLKDSTNAIIRMNFSEPMSVEGFKNLDSIDLSFYKFYKNNNLITISNPVIGTPNNKTVELKTDLNTFQVGDTIKIEVDPNLKDPAGNFFSQGVTSGELDNIKETRYEP